MTMSRRFHLSYVILMLAVSAASCSEPLPTAIEHLTESRRLAADLAVQLTKVAEASNRAVMAGTDESASSSAKEARDSLAVLDADSARLGALLQQLQFTEEGQLLGDFGAAFKKYRESDTAVLELSVQNTNLKAQRLAFGPAAEAAAAFVGEMRGLTPASAADAWKLRAIAAEAEAGVREIQALEAPHIAEANDDVMTKLEQRMSAIEHDIRESIATVLSLTSGANRARVTAASTSFDKFVTIHAELIRLSRTNSNVRSLALALGQSRNLEASCEATVQALRRALDERTLGPAR